MSHVATNGSATPLRGRTRGPMQGLCEVLAYRRIGDYHSISFVAPDVAERALPGQFVSIGVGGQGTLLRRPFSIYGVGRHGPWAGSIEIVFDVVGPGTAWLTELARHDLVDIAGPLGRGFPLPQRDVPCLLVGGGYGAAPLLFLAEELRQDGLPVDVLIGAATQSRIFNAAEAKRLSRDAVFTTEDGSFGVPGRVTDVLPDLISSSGAGVIYACGPMGMLAGVANIARVYRVPCQVAVEEFMACGVGVCMTCVVPYRRGDDVRNVRACVEGPVFDAKRVSWEAIRTDEMRGEEVGP